MDQKYRFSSDTADIDRESVHRWLSEQSYWAKGRSRAVQDAAIDSSINFGVYDSETGQQVAYARAVTDGVTFAWLCDVFVLPEVRGSGIGTGLLAGLMEELGQLSLDRVVLATRDAHTLYAKFGFASLHNPISWMTLAEK